MIGVATRMIVVIDLRLGTKDCATNDCNVMNIISYGQRVLLLPLQILLFIIIELIELLPYRQVDYEVFILDLMS
jgi:hypothetical protein